MSNSYKIPVKKIQWKKKTTSAVAKTMNGETT